MEKLKDMVDKLGLPDDEPIYDNMLSKAVENTQKTIESINFRIRKGTLEFDQILNNQRETIYNERNKILNGEDMSDFIQRMIKETMEDIVEKYTGEGTYAEEWDLSGLQDFLDDRLRYLGRVNLKDLDMDELVKFDKDKLKNIIIDEGLKIYKEREEDVGEAKFRYVERLIFMRNIDKKWMEHLDVVEQIRQGIGFQGIGREDPVRVFNREAFELFSVMLHDIKEETIRYIFGLRRKKDGEAKEVENITAEEREKRLLELEDKYKINKEYLPKVPANYPKIGFSADINATEEIEVEVSLYYLNRGIEERIDNYDQRMKIKGVFPVEFEKPRDSNWEKGWYQVKVFVAGEEAKNINFIVTEAVDLEEMKRKRENKAKTDTNIQFFSNQSPNISFKLELKDYEGDSIQASLIYNKDQNNISKFAVPIKNNKGTITLRRPKNGWKDGFYQLFLGIEEKNQMTIPFMIVDSYNRDEEQLKVSFNLNIPEGKDIDIVGQLVYIETRQPVTTFPIKASKSEKFDIELTKKHKSWGMGRYEFRLIVANNIIFTKHFLIK